MPLKTFQDELPALNLTPMIDIVFLLVIFFMVGTKFAELERSLKLDVPRVQNADHATVAAQRRVINVYADGTVVVDGRQMTIDELTADLTRAHQASSDLGVIIRGAADGPLQNVTTVLSACREAGVDHLSISVRLDSRRM